MGSLSEADLAELLHQKLDVPADANFVRLTLDQLAKVKLVGETKMAGPSPRNAKRSGNWPGMGLQRRRRRHS